MSIPTPSMPSTSTSSELRPRLRQLMSRPQRHRLLHGYPLAAAMPYADHEVRRKASVDDARFSLDVEPGRNLLVGVLPHPFCNPKVSGCGFCTFPHETFHRQRSEEVVRAVAMEISRRVARDPRLGECQVDGLYFGGGTANLTPAETFRHLSRRLNNCFDLSRAEISLEGVPAYFVARKQSLLDVMVEEISGRHFRISMGLQTFSEQRLKEMGRLAFGKPNTFAAAVGEAHRRGMTASGDLLFNLPGQSLSEMRADVRRAIDIGLDQICLYHLVMFRGLGTPWSKREDLLAALPSNEEAADNWIPLRQELIGRGYRQTTLTNFERKEVADNPRRYQYELMSFEPDRYQMLGFGPAGISFTSASDHASGLKVMNPESSAEYLQASRRDGPLWNRFFEYDHQDLRLLYATRRIAALGVDQHHFKQVYGQAFDTVFGEELELLREEGLLVHRGRSIEPTPRGMFYSDAIVGLLAGRQLRRHTPAKVVERLNSNDNGFM